MLQRAIHNLRKSAAAAISQFYKDRYHPHAVLVPSGRFGLYAVAAELFSPGDQVLISPLTCRTVIDNLLAARALPVFVDIDLSTGNIDVGALPAGLLSSAKAIITTNLYGNPDHADELGRIAQRRGLRLIEDCAHVLDTTLEGRPIGTFGEISIFSFKKYFMQSGGVVTLRDDALSQRLAKRVTATCLRPPQTSEALRLAEYGFELAIGPALTRRVARLSRSLRPAAAAQLSPAHPGVRTPTLPTAAELLRVADCLARFGALAAARRRDTEALVAECGLTPRRSGRVSSACYLVVPFWSAARDRVIAGLQKRGIPTYFTYCPSLDRVFPDQACCEYVTPDRLTEWCARILPVDVRRRPEFIEELAQCRR